MKNISLKLNVTVLIRLLLFIIVLIAFGIRIWGVDFGLPYLYHPDEPNKVQIAQQILKTGDLNPHYFLKPSFFIYLNTIIYFPYLLFENLHGPKITISSLEPPHMLGMGIGYTPQPRTVLIGRLLSVIIGVLSVISIYFFALNLFNSYPLSLLAAFLLAISPDNVIHSRYVTPDIYVVFFTILTAISSFRLYKFGERKDYIFSAISVGLAASVKYNAGSVIIFPIVAHLMRRGIKGITERHLYMIGIISVFTFLILNPYSLLDFPNFYKGVTFEASHYATGHAGMEGNSFFWYVNYLIDTYGLLILLSIFGLILAIYKKDRDWIFVLSFPLAYFVFISSFKVRNDRTILPITPFLIIFAIYFVNSLIKKFTRDKRLQILGFISIFSIISILMITKDIKYAKLITQPDGRETSRIWIEQNLPEGSKLAIESYSPFVNPEKFQVQWVRQIIDHDLNWYYEQGFEYLIFSQGMYGRYFAEPQKYNEQVKKYQEFFEKLTPIIIFNDGNYEVRIYKIQR